MGFLLLIAMLDLSATGYQELAGSFSGKLNINQGQASYRIPIEVPLGIRGLQPELSVLYHSAAGNGLLGVGWTLGGLSAISRCHRSIAQDGAKGGIHYDANDRYCLDGQRLVLVKGTYGADGSEYRTEIDSYQKIVAVGQHGSGPAHFEVRTKSGRIITYGAGTSYSRLENSDGTQTYKWSISHLADTSGNTIYFNYHNDKGIFAIDNIQYAGHKINFAYEQRLDKINGHFHNPYFSQAHRFEGHSLGDTLLL